MRMRVRVVAENVPSPLPSSPFAIYRRVRVLETLVVALVRRVSRQAFARSPLTAHV